MSAIVGESLFFEAARVLRGNSPISYYQFKALDALIEIVALHDRVALFAGEETDSAYLSSFDWLINSIHEKSDFKIDIITPKHRGEYITSEVMRRFNEVSDAIYPHPLGITSDELFGKQKKDRTAEDMSERIEQIFNRDYPNVDWKKFGTDIYEVWQRNANSSELLYFFRAHLLQAMAEIKGLTPIYENQRLIASIAQRKSRQENRIGTLPYDIYTMANKLFTLACESLRGVNTDYPKKSILMIATVGAATSRDTILDSMVNIRRELKEYRQHYGRAEEILKNQDASLSDRSEIQQSLTASANKIWFPVISSLGQRHTAGAVKRIVKGVFEKYGVGEVKYEHSDKFDSANPSGSSEDTSTYATPSLLGVGVAIGKTLYDVSKDSKLQNPNKPLLDVLLKAINMKDVNTKFSALFPVRDFRYRTYKLVDSLLAEEEREVTQ